MSKQVSSKTSSTKNGCITNPSKKILSLPPEYIWRQSNQQFPKWRTVQSVNHLHRNELVIYDDRLSTVSFICTDYVVITPKDMQYGICVFISDINQIYKLYYELPDQESKDGN